MVAEALECLGGNGYVEESGMPLLFRESPLNSIWEGSGNVNALDVLRALGREPEVLEAWLTEVGLAQGEDPRLDRAIEGVLSMLADTTTLEVSARRLAGQMAACLQASLLRAVRSPGDRRRASARPGSAVTTTARSGRCRSGPTCARSWSGRRPSSAERPAQPSDWSADPVDVSADATADR